MDFVGFPKIARYSRECIVTEKIDGTNAQVWIPTDEERAALPEKWRVLPFIVGSRTRWLFPPGDNHGFAAWAYANATNLAGLGPGHHFGEWWGPGIQRGYGIKEKRFSLFNVGRWADASVRPACCDVVPTIWTGPFDQMQPQTFIDMLVNYGSYASPGFLRPEGIVIYHVAGNHSYKKTIDRDTTYKGAVV